jgi:flagellar motor switch protein FliM
MAEQILSQEEIDALLSAMDRGDVDLQQGQGEPEAKPYNLTSQNILLRDQFSAFGEICDKFAVLLNASLSAMLQRSMEMEFSSTEMIKYQEFINTFSAPTSFTIFTMEPLIGSALLAVEPGLVFSLIDTMFGGAGRPVSRIRDFTQLEQRMIGKIAGEVLGQFQKAWQIVYPVRIQFKKTETKPEYVHLVSPHDMMVVLAFTIKAKEFSGQLKIGLSYLMLEPIKDQLSQKYLREKDIENTWSRPLRQLLHEIPVTLIAELGRTHQTVGSILNLKVDDVLLLTTGPEDSIVMSIDHVPKYLAYPGVIKGNRAVEISALLSPHGGQAFA